MMLAALDLHAHNHRLHEKSDAARFVVPLRTSLSVGSILSGIENNTKQGALI